MQVEVKRIVEHCQKYLNSNEFSDMCLNGLQVEGAIKTSKVISGVSLSQDLIRAAIKKKAKMLLVHHGIFDKHFPSPFNISGFKKERLKLLLENNINLVGFHLPLDAHPTIGNNIALLNMLGLVNPKPIATKEFGEIGFLGEFKNNVLLTEFIETVNKEIETESNIIKGGKKSIKTVGIVAGSASIVLETIKEVGADVFLTGEIKESTVRAAEELKINVIAAGHYNTEKLGIQNLGELIAKKFGVRHEFVDVPCEI